MQLPFAISLPPDTALANRTGIWRVRRPQYVTRQPPCNHGCPAGENIQRWLYLAEEGRYEEAWRQIVEDNPFPAIHGRVCYHPCETACNRGVIPEGGGPVSVHAIERFLGDLALRNGWDVPRSPSTGKRILVIGSGPCGLAAAYHLARLGHGVTVHEAAERLGGMMRYGIPAFRLPRDVIDGEIGRLARLGVEYRTGVKCTNATAQLQDRAFDAVLVAIGAGAAKHVDIPAAHAGRVLDAIRFLHDAAEGNADVRLGRRVAIYGGGNTAMDAARVAKRCGAEEAVIIYRRDRAHSPAHGDEIQEALDEGVVIQWLRTIQAVDGEALRVEVMRLDDEGRPAPTGEFEDLRADTLILALGQNPESGWLASIPGVHLQGDGAIEVDDNFMTGYPGLFAGGDAVPADRTVATAVGHGKRAARGIDAWLRGERCPPPSHLPLATADRLNPWYYSDAPRSIQPTLDRLRRATTFDETTGGLDDHTALYEARRCLSCGNCFGCDNCYGLCPDNAITKLAPGKFEVNLDYCKGCGICAHECPCGAIDMVDEHV